MKTNKMKTNKLAMLLFVMIFTGMSINSMAQRGNMRGQNFQKGQRMNLQNEWMCPIPDLTEDQKAKIKTLRLKNQKEMTKKRNLMREKQARLITLQSEDNLNMKNINNTIDQIANMRAEMMKSRIANQQEVRNLLTDDQKVFFDNWQNKGNKGRFGRGYGQGYSGRQGYMGRSGQGNFGRQGNMRNGMRGQRMQWQSPPPPPPGK
ncbi:MAG: Spy/CpxP family protein refolding chaperone [Bacteroidales bacterium]|nr:Spy/CpxP family protein refolding chaperone [Bacteroidales bacterium]